MLRCLVGDYERFGRPRGGRTPPALLLSLDQRKCFDRHHIDTLEDIASHLGLGEAAVFQNNRNLTGLLFVASQLLRGVASRRAPLGSRTDAFWPLFSATLKPRRGTSLATGTFQRTRGNVLDGRLAVAKSWGSLHVISQLTLVLDHTLETELDVTK